ncbi:acrB/AcrD/AcrF family protein, partial [Vibrio parahaemolyticus AQ3810]
SSLKPNGRYWVQL